MRQRPVSHESHKPCKTRKRRYRDREEAKVMLRHFQDAKAAGLNVRETIQTRCYKCPFCKGWHLTSQPLRVSA